MRISDWSSDVCSSDLIGQKLAVKVIYLGYAASSQMACLALMAKQILVSQSTSGDVPESGLDVLNQDGDSVEVALARQLVAAVSPRQCRPTPPRFRLFPPGSHAHGLPSPACAFFTPRSFSDPFLPHPP